MSDFTHDEQDSKSDHAKLLVQSALRYVNANIPVFPLRPFDKVPALSSKEGGQGFADATTNPDVVRAWWKRWPMANIGIPTGNASGLWVMDLDGEKGRQSFSELQDEYDVLYTPIISTTGNGQHLFFKMNGREIRNRAGIRPGIDVRGTGGYIVASPSIHPTGVIYSWVYQDITEVQPPHAPDWACDLAEKKVSATPDTDWVSPSSRSNNRYVEAAVEREVRAVASARKGQRNDRLNIAACSLGGFVGSKLLTQSRFEDALFAAAKASGLVDDDGELSVRKTIQSGLKKGLENPRSVPEREDHPNSGDKAKREYAAKRKQVDEPVITSRPEIRIVAGELPRVVDEAEQALIANNASVFQRGSMLVSVGRTVIKTRNEKVEGPRIVPLISHALVEELTRSAQFTKYDARSETWVRTDCTPKIADTYLARGIWNVSPLAGIIEAPTMRYDGSILDQPGYDPESGLMLIGKVEMSSISERPSKDAALKSLEILKEPIANFPFKSDADKSVVLSGMLTAVARRAFKSAPLHAFTATVAGSGKGKLVDTISMMVTGRPAAVISQGKNEEEAEKRLGSALISGDPLISIDNLEQPLGGELLCQCLTQQSMKIRWLGKSQLVEVPSIATMFATGNNMAVLGDMTRRTLVCRIDPECERPELREFDFDPMVMVGQDRERYIAAALTILRAYVISGFPEKLKPLGSFEDWSDYVRSSLVWLGQADPVGTMEQARESDPQLAALRAVMMAWAEIAPGEQVTASTLAKHANAQRQNAFGAPMDYENEELREALLTVAGNGGTISTRSLGRWLKANSGRVVNGMRITIMNADAHNGARYILEVMKA